jgi:hypothetical protein
MKHTVYITTKSHETRSVMLNEEGDNVIINN